MANLIEKVNHPDFWKFIENNSSANPSTLRLKWHGKDKELEITQIECRQKFSKKIPKTLSLCPKFVFQSVLTAEQCTSDLLASYHAQIADKFTYSNDQTKTLVDLTAGMGIDAIHMAEIGYRVTAIEKDNDKIEALRWNSQHILDKGILVPICADCREFIEQQQGEAFDVAFIDPARRSEKGGRTYALSDCSPDVSILLPQIQRIANVVIIKASPMLDITALSKSLPGLKSIYAIGTRTECKEIVAVVGSANANALYDIHAVTLSHCSIEEFSFTKEEEELSPPSYITSVQTTGYIYEPYPSIMKASPFNILSNRYAIKKLHPNTNLYYSENLIDTFPGDILKIEKVVPYESKYIKRLNKEYPKIQITTRNFDLTPEILRKKLGVKDGGENRLFAVTLYNGTKYMFIAK